jgi:hypothetical protein
MQWHATSQQTDEEKEDEVQEYIIKPLIRKLQEMGPKPGYTEEMWMDYLGHLASLSVYKGDGTMNSRLWRSEPPQGYGTQFWGAFVNVISKDVKDTIRAACRVPEEKEQTPLFVEEHKNSEQVATRTFVEHWDGHTWQTEQRRTHTFVDKSQKVSEVAIQEDNVRRCPEIQAVHMDYHIERTLGFIDETELGNNETRCARKNFHLTRVEDDKSHHLTNKTSVGHQMDVYSSQAEPSDNTSALAFRESRGHHANPQKWGTKMYSLERAPKEPDIEKQHGQKGAQVTEPIAIDVWTSYSGRMNPEAREVRQRHSDEVSIGHQTAVPPYGESRQHQGDTVYRRRSFMNNEHTRWVEDPLLRRSWFAGRFSFGSSKLQVVR